MAKVLRQTVGEDLDQYYRPLRNVENRFWQDRAAMKAGNFTGITGFPNSGRRHGTMADCERWRERLGASDSRSWSSASRWLQPRKPSPVGNRRSAPVKPRSRPMFAVFRRSSPATTDWREFAARYVWDPPNRRSNLIFDLRRPFVKSAPAIIRPCQNSASFACWNYDRTRALLDGSVQPDGIDLNYFVCRSKRHSSAWHGTASLMLPEMSFSSYCVSLNKPERPFVALPVYPSRFFFATPASTSTRGPESEPKDLIGKRIASPEYQMTAPVWIRGILQDHYGVPVTNADGHRIGSAAREEPGPSKAQADCCRTSACRRLAHANAVADAGGRRY